MICRGISKSSMRRWKRDDDLPLCDQTTLDRGELNRDIAVDRMPNLLEEPRYTQHLLIHLLALYEKKD